MVFDDDNVNQHFAENEDEENTLIVTLIVIVVYIVISAFIIAWYARKQAKYYIARANKVNYLVPNTSETCIWVLLLFFNSFAIPVVWCRGDLPGQVNTKLAEIFDEKNQQSNNVVGSGINTQQTQTFTW